MKIKFFINLLITAMAVVSVGVCYAQEGDEPVEQPTKMVQCDSSYEVAVVAPAITIEPVTAYVSYETTMQCQAAFTDAEPVITNFEKVWADVWRTPVHNRFYTSLYRQSAIADPLRC